MATEKSAAIQQSPLSLFFRTLGYWLPSGLAFYCGLAVYLPFRQDPNETIALGYPAWALFIIPLGLSLAFFYAYSASFTMDGILPDKQSTTVHRQSYALWSLAGGVIALVGLLLYLNSKPPVAWPPTFLSISVATYITIVFGYGLFLVLKYSRAKYSALRYQLIWPILITIAIPLYISISIKDFTSWEPLVPFAIFVAYGATCEIFFRSRKSYLIFSFSLITAGLIFAIWPLSTLPSQPSLERLSLIRLQTAVGTFLFAVAVSAYAAVFESWNVTAAHARSYQRSDDSDGLDVPHAARYYYGSFAALVLSVFFSALLFPVTSRGTSLLIFLFVHSIFAMFIWYSASPELEPSSIDNSRSCVVIPQFLRSNSWWILKVFMGSLIFVALGVDFFLGSTIRQTPLFAESVTVTVFITTFNIMGFVRNSDFPTLSTDDLIIWYSTDKKRLLKHMFVFIIFGLGITFGVTNNNGHVVADGASDRAGNAFQLFNLYALITLLSLVLAYIPYDRRTLMKSFPDKLLSALDRLVEKIFMLAVTVRLFASLVVGGVVTVVAFQRGGLLPYRAILTGLPFVLACMGGVSLNDYLDVETDRINRPYRALPSGKLKPSTVLAVAILCILSGTYFAFWAARSGVDLAIYLSAILGIVIYNAVVRYAAVCKTLYTGLISSLPYLFVVHRFSYDKTFLLFPLSVTLFITGRELWMDIHDIDGDRKSGISTAAVIFGPTTVGYVSSAFQIAAGLLLFPIAARLGSVAALGIASATILACLGLSALWLLSEAPKRRRLIYACWLPMLIGSTILYF